ncbi:serine integrase [Streptomyces phage PapayaSalad]|uniref:Serine integrase n=1 Tax=Streptomyces phage PapayaSalad TaxID=1920310 RepID=A0A1J0MC93_9CAUD|nr:integrase [Streptomyces phage PapayaSalad]APD18613.1 serine integrase [Streptomyces phage PapayaSalad]
MTSLYVPPSFTGGPPPDDLPWLGYIRVSTWKEEKISPELQESAIRQWAARTGRRLLDEMIVDLDATGRNFNRKIQQAIEAVENRKARGIAVWRFSRFGRNRTGNAVALARLERAGGDLESATEPLDAKTAVGELQREMIFAFGNFESNRAGEQWRETHEHRRNLKLPATGGHRFGYIWHPRRVPDATAPGGWRLQEEFYEVHPEYASIAEEMYDRKLNLGGFSGIAHWLNDELGVPNLRGNRWKTRGVRRYLDSGFAAGLLRTHDPKCGCGYGTTHFEQCKEGRVLYLPGAQPALITPQEWEAYLDHREDIKSRPPRTRKAVYTLSGISGHGHCRGTAVFRNDRVRSGENKGAPIRGHHLVCSANKNQGKSACEPGLYVLRTEAEEAVLQWLADKVAEDVDALVPEPRKERVPEVDPRARAIHERARIEAEVAKLDAAIGRLVVDNAKDPDKFPEGAFEAARNQLVKEKGEALDDLKKIAAVEAMPTQEKFRPLMVGLIEEWETFSAEERNAMLRQVIWRAVMTTTPAPEKIGRKSLVATFEVHPKWEPDPWKCKRCGKHIPGPGPLVCPDGKCQRA